MERNKVGNITALDFDNIDGGTFYTGISLGWICIWNNRDKKFVKSLKNEFKGKVERVDQIFCPNDGK